MPVATPLSVIPHCALIGKTTHIVPKLPREQCCVVIYYLAHKYSERVILLEDVFNNCSVFLTFCVVVMLLFDSGFFMNSNLPLFGALLWLFDRIFWISLWINIDKQVVFILMAKNSL